MIKARDFVIAWQQAESLDDVCQELELDPRRASERASRLRKRGVELQYFRDRDIDYEALADLATSIQKAGEGS